MITFSNSSKTNTKLTLTKIEWQVSWLWEEKEKNQGCASGFCPAACFPRVCRGHRKSMKQQRTSPNRDRPVKLKFQLVERGGRGLSWAQGLDTSVGNIGRSLSLNKRKRKEWNKKGKWRGGKGGKGNQLELRDISVVNHLPTMHKAQVSICSRTKKVHLNHQNEVLICRKICYIIQLFFF